MGEYKVSPVESIYAKPIKFSGELGGWNSLYIGITELESKVTDMQIYKDNLFVFTENHMYVLEQKEGEEWKAIKVR